LSLARITSGSDAGVARLMLDTSESPALSDTGGYERKLASNHQDSSVPSLSRESKPLLPLAVGRFRTDPFMNGVALVGAGLMAVTVAGPTIQ
jgi:hypothetical protein